MAMVDHAPEVTSDSELQSHLATYHVFVRMIWWNVAAIAVALILLAAWAG
ncbi:MAG: aa3-type cytochrome c oxidase subunit IV [Hyphomicrobiales bacterium]|nr:aa3-type cytochrome c oxidase subunit IV [Hyphomicrobiales bacterium]